jgi:hypothetical protein
MGHKLNTNSNFISLFLQTIERIEELVLIIIDVIIILIIVIEIQI